MSLLQSIIDLAVKQVDFKNEALETAAEAGITTTIGLYDEVSLFEDVFDLTDEQNVLLGEGIIELAGILADAAPLTDDQETKVVGVFSKIVGPIDTPQKRQSAINVFRAAINTIQSLNALNDAADAEPTDDPL